MQLIAPVMITIPAGTCTMGVPAVPGDAKLAHPWTGPKTVQVAAFAIGQTAVTVWEYLVFLEATHQPISDHLKSPVFGNPNLPITDISWADADAYARWLAEATGEPYRLPTDAEWEYAARGGVDGCAFPWGNEPAEGRADFGQTVEAGPKPAMSFAPNGFGLYNMVGNVWQWCSSLYIDVADDAPVNNPTGMDLAQNRVLRGGSYITPDPVFLWCAYRHEDPTDLRHACLGFRVAKDV